jgi:uncharacterized membrane protein YphA (DoxX/SURF4 family)
LLFVYAAISKLLDFENFKIQLGQSPILSPYAMYFAWGVPIIELILAFLLLFNSCKIIGLLGSYIMMVLFIIYIYILLHHSSFLPCSCGGVLERMNWNEHLIFNFTFLVLAVFGILFLTKKRIIILLLLSTPFLGFAFLWALFQVSENKIESQNPFVRQFPPKLATYINQTSIEFNSYYFAGYGNGTIYLGNYTAPLHVLEIDTTLHIKRKITIDLDIKANRTLYRKLQLRVLPPYFYLMDGTVPLLHQGFISNWKINKTVHDSPFFTLIEPMDSISLAIRSNSSKNGKNQLGIFSLHHLLTSKMNPDLLKKHPSSDGIFDTEGTLLYSTQQSLVLYVNRYTNDYVVADKQLNAVYRGKTIDTISTPQIKIVKQKNERKMSAPPLIVNPTAAVYDNLLFVNSNLRGRYDAFKTWKSASTIDVYDITKKIYLFSFYINSYDDKKLKSFYITDSYLFAIIDNQLVRYQLSENVIEKMKSTIIK